MRLDAHQHFWRYDAGQYPWIPVGSPLHRDWLPEDLVKLQKPLGLDGSIAVQARQSVEESDWLLSLADSHPVVKGVVGWVDLRAPDVAKDLERLSRHPKFVGVRHVVQDEPDLNFMLGDAFVRGIGQLAAFNLTYDILIYPQQLPAAIALVKKFPQQKFVLDHMAKPVIKAHLLEPWSSDLKRLAEHPNVHCKVSGMLTEADHHHQTITDFKPYLDIVFNAFTPKRLMFGSDWPVCRFAGEYAQAYGVVEWYIQRLTSTEQQAIWGLNAAAFYFNRK